MVARKDKCEQLKKKLTDKLNRWKLHRIKRLQRRLRQRTNDDDSVRNMSVKDIVRLLMEYCDERGKDFVSKMLHRSKHKNKRRRNSRGKNKDNRTSTASAVENNDKQVMDVTPPSTATHAGGEIDENGDANGNTMTANNGSTVYAPKLYNCNVKGNINMNWNNPISFAVKQEQDGDQVVLDPGSNLAMEGKRKQSNLLISDIIKADQKKRCETIAEGIANSSKSSLNKVYTELYIVTCKSTSVNDEHEVWHAETAHLKDSSEASVIKCQDIFKPDQDTTIRTVMTKGIAGIGKSVAAQKLNLDWASNEANQGVDFVFFLSFRKLNFLKGQYSLHALLREFYPQLKEMDIQMYYEHKILIILDGLDESQLALEFDDSKLNLTSVTEPATLDILLINLIAGCLLPDACLWITSRPVASNQIPPIYIDRVTEIRGFNDSQKDEYFKRKISDPETASRILSYIKKSRSLYVMCHIPVFTWMAVTVLQDLMLKANKDIPKPTTITEMYMHYVRVQTNISFGKHGRTCADDDQSILMLNKDLILKLGKLAYENLLCKNVLFTKQHLRDCDISVNEAGTCPGLCTELVDFEHGLYEKKIYCFVHLSVQEFFAAVYAFHEFNNNRLDSLKPLLKKKKPSSMVDFLKGAIDSALDSKNGHLDLFTRFLVGVSHKSSRDILQGILESAISNSESPQKLIVFIKNLKRKTLSPERCINLIHCLLQLKDDSILQKDNRVSSKTQLTPFQSTFLAYKFIISEKPEEFNFRNNKTSDDVFYRLTPALRACTTALLNFCHITPEKCATVAWVLQASSRLTVLDLGHNDLGDAGVRRLCDGLRNPNCKVETLNLSYNNVGTRGVEELCTVLTPNSKLLTLDLSGNDFGNSGLKFLVNSLRGGCTLQVLRLSGCSITSSEDVNSARVLSNTFQMKGLDLTYNPFRDTGYPDIPQQLTINDGAESWNRQGLYKYATPMQLALDPDTVNHYLLLSERDRKVIRQKTELQYPETQERFDKCNQVLCKPSLNERHYLEVECLRNAYVGVAYERLKRKGSGDCVKLGHNKDSWTLYTSDSGSHAQHNNISHLLHTPDIKADVPYKVGVFLDWPAGLVSFYLVNNETRIHLYAYYTKFTDPLYFAIRLNTPNATVSLLT